MCIIQDVYLIHVVCQDHDHSSTSLSFNVRPRDTVPLTGFHYDFQCVALLASWLYTAKEQTPSSMRDCTRPVTSWWKLPLDTSTWVMWLHCSCVCWYKTVSKLLLMYVQKMVTALNSPGVRRWWPPHAGSGLQGLGWGLHGWLETAAPRGQHRHGRARGETWWAVWRDRERHAG